MIASLSAVNILFDGGDGNQSYLIFQPVYKYFKFITGTTYISSWKSKGLSDESIKSPTTSDNSLTPVIGYYDYKITVKFNGGILRQPKVTYTHKKKFSLFINLLHLAQMMMIIHLKNVYLVQLL